ncbi:DUF6090 family protein [Fulvivirga sedimenti]|uniref:Uncharacterized protein n=1 Tax=Fulvivirga sedimenti TaxID=2879465 RepID=A0A9X1KYP0_9BACT|nr:DUF6090 family protein [Fulvivirga sedimenti]MCA6073816.1 hypothetical protein [Fulvivirga sedimenti]
MIKFFRNIRRQLLSENPPAGRSGKFSKYLLYAVGEIVLVVIGILIALQINLWNEGRKEFIKSKALLEEFKKDLVRDTLESNYVTGKLKQQVKIEAWALGLTSYNSNQTDSLRRVFFGPYFQQPITVRTFNKLQNSENPNLTGFENLQNELTKYYTDTKYLVDAYNDEEKHYAFENEINQIIRSKLEINLNEFPMLPEETSQDRKLIDFVQSIEGRNYIKENYIRRKSMIDYFENVKQEATALIHRINESLESS